MMQYDECYIMYVTHTHTHNRFTGAGTRKVKPGRVKPVWIYWSKRQWVAVAFAGLYASLHLIPDNHANIPPLICFTDRMPFLPPIQQHQSTEGNILCMSSTKIMFDL